MTNIIYIMNAIFDININEICVYTWFIEKNNYVKNTKKSKVIGMGSREKIEISEIVENNKQK
jgi:hypothetical protein